MMRMDRAICVLGLSVALLVAGGCQPAVKKGGGAVQAPVVAAPEAQAKLRELQSKALAQVVASSRSADPSLRAHALEAAQYMKERVGPLVALGLEDENPAVRFTALTVIGKKKMGEMAGSVQPLLRDANESVRAAAIFALKAGGREIDVSPLAQMLLSPRHTTRANVAILLGLLGDPSAAPMLKDAARSPLAKATEVQETIVRLQIAEALLRLGDESVVDSMRAYAAYSQHDEVRVAAVMMVGELEDRRFAQAIEPLLREPPVELQLAAAGTLARFGNMQGLELTLRGAEDGKPMVRMQAALTLGLFADVRAVGKLKGLLEDGEERVRVAAAAAVLRMVKE